MQRFGGSGRAGNHAERGGAGAAQILVRQVEELLVVGVGVNGGHGAALNAKRFVKNLGDGSEAIGGAGGVGNDVVFRGIVELVIDAQHEGGVRPIRRRGDNHLFHRATQMLLRFGALGEKAGGFNDDVSADAGPIDLRRILRLEYLEGAALNADGVLGMRNLVRQIAQHRIVFEKMREGFGVRDVVDGHELNVLAIDRGAHNVATDAAEAVDTYLDGHTTSFAGWSAAASTARKTPQGE